MDKALAEITPEQFDEWVEMDGIVPFGDEKLCHVMALGFAAICNRIPLIFGGSLPEVDYKTFLPWEKKKKRQHHKQAQKKEYVNPNQAAMMFRMAMGNRG